MSIEQVHNSFFSSLDFWSDFDYSRLLLSAAFHLYLMMSDDDEKIEYHQQLCWRREREKKSGRVCGYAHGRQCRLMATLRRWQNSVDRWWMTKCTVINGPAMEIRLSRNFSFTSRPKSASSLLGMFTIYLFFVYHFKYTINANVHEHTSRKFTILSLFIL